MHHHLYVVVTKSVHYISTLVGYQSCERIGYGLSLLIEQEKCIVGAGEKKIASQEYKYKTQYRSVFLDEFQQSSDLVFNKFIDLGSMLYTAN